MPELLHDWVGIQASRRPEALAVVGSDDELTYAQLEAASNRLARLLKEGGCKRGDRVCLLMPKCPAAIVGLLGIYKADCLYVPLDPASPPERLKRILDICESRWILAAGPEAAVLQTVFADERWRTAMHVGWMGSRSAAPDGLRTEFTANDLGYYSAEPVTCDNARHDPAHILFTSGSTGTPKGVVITHAGVIHFIEWAVKYFGINSTDRLSCHPPFHFDLSFLDIFGAFASGAQLHLVPAGLNVLPNKLAEFIRASGLTQWFSVPAVLNYLAKFDAVKLGDFPALRRVLWCGDVLPTPALIYWMKRLPHVRFTNLYGPTETTIASSYYTVPACPEDEKAQIPIGTACEGEELLVLDEHLQPVACGQIGDLYIRGVGLSPGYWRDPERTRAAFLPDPWGRSPSDRIYKTGDLATIGRDGLVYFLGRADLQIKSRGYRIELGEIEAALNANASLQECAVVAVETEGFEGKTICCAYAAAPGAPASPATLRKHLSAVLPPYMVPTRWKAFDRLPQNANGKIDRRRLMDLFARDATQTPRQS